jgi:Flp pilus assembly protein TadG
MRGRPPLAALRGSTEGGAAVELAMIAPVLLLLVLGTIELARIVGLRSELHDAATSAARAAVARGLSATSELRAVAEERLRLGPTSGIQTFSVAIDSPAEGVDRVRVTIRYGVELFVPLLGLPPIVLEVEAAGYRDS